MTLEDEANTSLIDAAEKESRLDPSDDGAIAAYEGWIAEKCAHLDAALKAINDRRDQV